MKKFFFFFLISISVEAQTSVYHPFPDSNAVWVVGVSCNVFPCSCGFFTRYTMGGDTLINGNIYHKIIQDGIPICNPCGCFYIGYYQFIREDTLKRIWAFDSAFMTDTLLYDFNLNLGDTIKTALSNLYPGTLYIVQSIDSILIGNNYRKRFNYSNSLLGMPDFTCSNFLIEGIGSGGGLFSPTCAGFCFEQMYTLSCFKQDGNILYYYQNCTIIDTSSVCNFTVSIPETESKKLFTLSPNPTHDFITIKNNQTKELSIKIFSSIGEVVQKTTLGKDAVTTINLSGLAAGIYMVTARSDRDFSFRKLVKQ